MREVSITIVTWNSRLFIVSCLHSLSEQTLKDFEVTVIDNGSRDGTVELIEERFGRLFRLIRNGSNEGYCRAHNKGVAASTGKYVLTLNPDVFLAPTFLERMVQAISATGDIGSANGKLLRVGPSSFEENGFRIPPGEPIIDSTGLMMLPTRRQFLRGHMSKDEGQFDQMTEVFGPDGAAALYRREMLEDVRIDGQYFDESFFSHKEDVDLAWRAQLRGWKSVYAPDAVAYHVRGFKPGDRVGMSPEVKRHAVKNRYLMMLKNELLSTFLRDWLHILSYEIRILGYILLFERSSLRAYWDSIRLAPHALHWRKIIQRRRKADPSYMAGLFVGETASYPA